MVGVSGHVMDKGVDNVSMSQGLCDMKKKYVNLHKIFEKIEIVKKKLKIQVQALKCICWEWLDTLWTKEWTSTFRHRGDARPQFFVKTWEKWQTSE